MKAKPFSNKRQAYAFAKDVKGFVEELNCNYIVLYKERRRYGK